MGDGSGAQGAEAVTARTHNLGGEDGQEQPGWLAHRAVRRERERDEERKTETGAS